MIEWFARNPVAANLLMLTIVVVGVTSAVRSIPIEFFPSFEAQRVNVTTTLRGATPRSVEDAVTTRIEQAIFDLEGVIELSSSSSEGSSRVSAKIDEGYDTRELLNEIKLRVDALNSLPSEAEKPVVSLFEVNPAVLQLVVIGDTDPKLLRKVAESVREDLLRIPTITLVEIRGVTNYEMSIEVQPTSLERYGISLNDVANAIQLGSRDLSAGNIKSRGGDLLVRTTGQAYTQSEFANIPVITRAGADPILLGDIATITDGFEQLPIETRIDGTQAIRMNILRTGDQSAIQISNAVRAYIAEQNERMTNGIILSYWDDETDVLRDRLSTLLESGIWGGLLVLILLSLFLRPAIAFWVFIGIPVSFMGALIFMPLVGGSFNIMSLFAFITVLGIVVDDAIVTGENIYRKMREGIDPLEASITGTREIAVPVTFGILTTVVAFYPLTDLGANRFGFIAQQIPLVVIPVLLFSLIESKLVLPSHLSKVKPRNENSSNWLSNMQIRISRGFEQFVIQRYTPFLEKCLRNKAISIATLLTVSAIILSYAGTGHLKFTFFPRVESETVSFSLVMPDTTGFKTTQTHIATITQAVQEVQEKYRDPDTGISIVNKIFSIAGSSNGVVKPSIGKVLAELLGPEERHIDVRSTQIAREIRQRIGEIPGAQSLSVRAERGRGGEPIYIELEGNNASDMQTLGFEIREKLKQYPNVFDIQDTFSGGKEEINIELKPRAYALGLTLANVANQVRGSVFGFEAQRIQRGREEVRVMVRLPLEHRSSIEDLNSLPISVQGQSTTIPLSDLVELSSGRSPTTLNRLNRSSIIAISADVDKAKADVPAILRDLREFIEQKNQTKEGINFSFKGEAEEQSENNDGFKSGFILVLIAIYALLAIPFKSYTQPFIIMSIIPFSIVGAITGHIITGYDLSMLSVVGILALIGVVVNDSLVLVDYINKQRARGVEVFDAILKSGSARFRPVILTSITTFAGLTPLLLDSSTQAEFLKQMAISLGFGILFATIITLIFIPINYLLAYKAKHWSIRQCKKIWAMWLRFWHADTQSSNAKPEDNL